MKIRRNLSHVIVLLFSCVFFGWAQGDPTRGRILTLDLDPKNITTLELCPGFVTSVRLPEPVSSVVLGDPAAFKAEHSEAEPQLVFFKPTTSSPSHTNALIATRTGREIALTLISEGGSKGTALVDYVLKYERPRSFLIEAAHPSFAIEETKSIESTKLPAAALQEDIDSSERELAKQRNSVPHWQGKDLRVSVGRSTRNGNEMAVAFSVFNASTKTIELLPPQVELTNTAKGRHSNMIKAETVPIKSYRLTSRVLAPHARVDGIVAFERPAFKETPERLMLQIAQVEMVDQPVQAALSFVAPAYGGGR